MITDQAQRIAEHFVAGLDLKGYQARFVEIVCRERFPDDYAAIFDLYSPGGNLMDGPLLVIINKQSGQARLFESP